MLPRLLMVAMLLPAWSAGATQGCSTGEKECDRFVEARGVRIRLHLRPAGPQAVVFEAGSGLGAESWRGVFDALGDNDATLIAYDRAGMGRSDGLDGPYDVHDEVVRLHSALRQLGFDRKLVLVGHSYGGYLIHLYANLYPGDVRGLVYVDANTVEGIDALGGPGPIAEARIRANDVPDPDKAQKAGLRLSRALVATHETLRRYPVVCGVPVIAISAGTRANGVEDARFDGWRGAHRRLAERAGGEWRIAERSGHMIPRDQPDIVARAVLDVLARANDAGAYPGTFQHPCLTGGGASLPGSAGAALSNPGEERR